MACLVLHEYDQIHCGDTFDREKKTLTRQQFQLLERVNENYNRTHRARTFEHRSGNTLVAQNIVGTISFGQDQIEILPKIDRGAASVESDVRSRLQLIKMLAVAYRLKVIDVGWSKVTLESAQVLDIIIQLFCTKLSELLRSGLIHKYMNQFDDLPVMRGKIDIAQQIKRNLARPDRLSCRYDEFTEDNELNRILKLALTILEKSSNTASIRQQVQELLTHFHAVSTTTRSQINWRSVKLDRLTKPFEPLLAMSKEIIEGWSPNLSPGFGTGFALLFDMNRLFEQYIGAEMIRALVPVGYQVTLQSSRQYLASQPDGRQAFQLQPDIVVQRNGEVVAIVDTKWKLLLGDGDHRDVSAADAYQMFAYSIQYSAPVVILLYPHYIGLGTHALDRSTYSFNGPNNPDSNQRELRISTVALNDLSTVHYQLRALIKSCTRPIADDEAIENEATHSVAG